MNISVGPQVLGSYKRLNYTAWHAIAEFVDNSTQSFLDNRNVLESLSDPDQRPLKVEIEYDANGDFLRIEDNAMGMSEEELQRAMNVAEPPPNPQGRSRYGMGLKTAASWIGNLWTIRTKKLGHTIEHQVQVDIDEIVKGDMKLMHTTKDNCPESDHYTIVEITKHNRKFHGKTLRKIKTHLQSMYRQDFRDKILELVWQGEVLKWHEFDDLILRNANGVPYRKEFEFTIEDSYSGTNKTVSGWAGVLAKGSRSLAGFSQFHNNRVVKGWPDAWRPESIYGEATNDLVNQRLVGEIHLDEFDVTHTKDNIQFYGDQEELVEEKLAKACHRLRQKAQEYRKNEDDSRGPNDLDEEVAIRDLKEELESPQARSVISIDAGLTEGIVQEVKNGVIEATNIDELPETIKATVGSLIVKLYILGNASPNDPYLIIDSDSNQLIVIVNKVHPHWKQLEGKNGVLNFLRHCVYDGIAEWQTSEQFHQIDPDTVKLYKDKYLRLPMTIERNQKSKR